MKNDNTEIQFNQNVVLDLIYTLIYYEQTFGGGEGERGEMKIMTVKVRRKKNKQQQNQTTTIIKLPQGTVGMQLETHYTVA